MTGRTVLVLTRRTDYTADLVVRELNTRGIPLVRCDLAEFPNRLTLGAAMSPTGAAWEGSLRTEHHDLPLSEIGAVYYRRPTIFEFEQMSDVERSWATAEARAGCGGVLGALRCRWVNHPHRNAAASLKPVQLAAAVEAGLRVPPTLITNDPTQAREFARAVGGVVYKAFRPPFIGGQSLFTTVLDSPDVIDDRVRHTAHLFQQFIRKQYEVRLTVVGQQMFAARIDSHSDKSRVDFRADYDSLSYEPVELPEQVAEGVRLLMHHFGLHYAAHDFLVDRDNNWVYLETNPNGQWGWIEAHTGLPIAAALAGILEGAP